jgi:hypothetical protein
MILIYQDICKAHHYLFFEIARFHKVQFILNLILILTYHFSVSSVFRRPFNKYLLFPNLSCILYSANLLHLFILLRQCPIARECESRIMRWVLVARMEEQELNTQFFLDLDIDGSLLKWMLTKLLSFDDVKWLRIVLLMSSLRFQNNMNIFVGQTNE